MVDFPFLGGGVHYTPSCDVCVFRTLFVLQDCVLVLEASAVEAYFLLLSY